MEIVYKLYYKGKHNSVFDSLEKYRLIKVESQIFNSMYINF